MSSYYPSAMCYWDVYKNILVCHVYNSAFDTTNSESGEECTCMPDSHTLLEVNNSVLFIQTQIVSISVLTLKN